MSAPAHPASPLRVIVADDHELMRREIVRLVAEALPDAIITEAADGQQALRAFRHTRADLLVSDQRMPRMDGTTLTRRLPGRPGQRMSLLSPSSADLVSSNFPTSFSMASNRKLTPLLAERTLAGTTHAEGLLTLTFTDGSTLKVKTGEVPAPAPRPSPAVPSGASDTPHALPLTRGAPAPIAAAPAAAPAGKKVKKVRQRGTELNLDLEDGSSVTIYTAEATSSVMLRDHAGKLEYAD